MISRARIGRLAAVAVLGATAAIGTFSGQALADAPYTQAQAHAQTHAPDSTAAGGSCKTWKDRNTFGVKCGYSGYNAVARCKDGSKQYGLSVVKNRWSYAYCSGHRGLKYGWVAP
ncbi:hypothetical protein K378_00150 [Streptomyces sp. Amel2xB2]|uniref:hypothetical protein n=1 Tax=Streptomyces sp. Amel2xB2 TaxID=1305829 RepID=UPI000DBAC899|nr:hypothetical protein [Streptomyces sp. Amel2xB2]RAJ71332.1 hypothetical protein K378_00150 [Streptomyces sp. Amel2xB2]